MDKFQDCQKLTWYAGSLFMLPLLYPPVHEHCHCFKRGCIYSTLARMEIKIVRVSKSPLLAAFLLLMALQGYGSDSTDLKKNIVFATFGGKENFGSLNYEHVFSQGKRLIWSYSIGVQPFQPAKKFSVPVSLNAFTKGRIHHLEIDVNTTFYMDKYHPYNGGYRDEFNKQVYLSPFLCYRFQRCRGLVFKAGAGPQVLFDPPSSDGLKVRTKVLATSIFGSLGISF